MKFTTLKQQVFALATEVYGVEVTNTKQLRAAMGCDQVDFPGAIRYDFRYKAQWESAKDALRLLKSCIVGDELAFGPDRPVAPARVTFDNPRYHHRSEELVKGLFKAMKETDAALAKMKAAVKR